MSSDAELAQRLILRASELLVRTHEDPPPEGPRVLAGAWHEFDMFMNVDEWELAWETLEAIALRQRPPSEFWPLMARAAGEMDLGAHAARAKERARPAGA